MKVLVVHNAYQQKGGEDTVMEAEVALLRSRGHDVELFTRHNDAIGNVPKLAVAINTLWASGIASDFARRLKVFQPDVVHVHNTFPQISPAIHWVATRARIPVLQTLHNFRLLCPQAMFLREGKVCEDCLGKIPWRGATRGCYRGSKSQSSVLATMVTVHRAVGTWENKITRYIALNEFCRRKFIAGGLPESRIVVKPNFVDLREPDSMDRQGFLFVGRLSVEKGLRVLRNAHERVAGSELRVIGAGPDDDETQNVHGLTPLGFQEKKLVFHEMARAVALVMPSIWYETFGMVAVEAFAAGTPVIASAIGVLPHLIQDHVTGLLFEPGNSEDLARKMQWALANPEVMAIMGRNARKHYENEFTADRNYQQLMAIYMSAIEEVKSEAAL
jgi:glycosyltransferase involved in cell wall biosynthesis